MRRQRRRGLPAKAAGLRPEGGTRAVLDNGVAVVLCPRAQLAQVHIVVYFGVGSRHETPQINGVTHILEHMLFRGTQTFKDATALNVAAEELGGFLDGATYRDHMAFATGCHPSAVSRAIAILGEIVSSPRYRGIEVERSILREELLETLDNRGRMVDLDNIAHRAIFGTHPLGHPIEGTLENLENVDVPELETHRQRYLVGNQAVVSIAGPIDEARALASVRRAFGGLPAGDTLVTQRPPPPRDEPVLRYVRDPSSQVDIRITFPAVPVHDPEYPALVMLGRILADGLASRMHAELVDRRGLAYSLHAGLITYADCGLFEFEVSVAPDRAAEVIAGVLDFAAGASRFRFQPAELKRVWRRYRYGMEFMGDSAADLASWYGRSVLFGVERHMGTLGSRMTRVGQAAIRRAARKTFVRRGLVITAVGELARGQWRRVRQVVGGWKT